MKVAFSQAARTDLFEIVEYIAQDSPAQALRWLDDIEAHCQQLGRMPGIGAPRPELADGLRVLPHGRYLVFHRLEGRTVRIVRILHGARDIDHDDVDVRGDVDLEGGGEGESRGD